MSKISADSDFADVDNQSLAFSKDDQFFESLKTLILRVNEHAESREYAITLLRTKKSKLEIIRKAWIICDRDKKITESREQERRHYTSRQIECFFFLIAKKQKKSWFFKSD